MKKRYFKVCVSELILPFNFKETKEVVFENGVFYSQEIIDLCNNHPDKEFYFHKCVLLEEIKTGGDLFDLTFKENSNLFLDGCNVLDVGNE